MALKRQRGLPRTTPAVSYGVGKGRIWSVLQCCCGGVHIDELRPTEVEELRRALGGMLAEVGQAEISAAVRDQINGVG